MSSETPSDTGAMPGAAAGPEGATKSRSDTPEEQVFTGSDYVHIHGYLEKKTRDGRWQRRWFETNGCFLTYYKNKKMTKLLAALNLPQVDSIALLPDDHAEYASEPEGSGTGNLFSIQLNDRQYLLKAKEKEDAQLWVDKLNHLKMHPQSSGVENPVAKTSGGEEAPAGNIMMTSAQTDIAAAMAAGQGAEWGKSKRTGFCC